MRRKAQTPASIQALSPQHFEALTGMSWKVFGENHDTDLSDAENDNIGDGISNRDEETVFFTNPNDPSSRPTNDDIRTAILANLVSATTLMNFQHLLSGEDKGEGGGGSGDGDDSGGDTQNSERTKVSETTVLTEHWRCIATGKDGAWIRVAGSSADGFTIWRAEMYADWELLRVNERIATYSDGSTELIDRNVLWTSDEPIRTVWDYCYTQYFWNAGTEPFPGAFPAPNSNGREPPLPQGSGV